MNILITGALGYIGSHLTVKLSKHNQCFVLLVSLLMLLLGWRLVGVQFRMLKTLGRVAMVITLKKLFGGYVTFYFVKRLNLVMGPAVRG